MVSLPISPNLGINRSIAESRTLLAELHQQLATGKKVETYGDLGTNRNQILSLRSELAQIASYRDTIAQVDIRMDVMLQSLGRLREIASDTKSDALEVGFDLQAGGQTVYQVEVNARFDEVIGLLNTHVGDRHLFSGRQTETNPLLASSEILDGADTRDGFRQIVSERRQADLGVDGRGRLTLAGPLPASVTGSAVATPGDIGGPATAQFTIDIGGNAQTFDISDAGNDSLTALEAAIDTAFGADVASIIGGNQLQLTATNATDAITITDVDAGAAALAGLTSGTTANPPATVTVAEDNATSPFGFKLAAVNSQLTGATVTGPGGGPPPELSVQFTGTLPQDGEQILITFDLPDGTTQDIRLTARSSGPLAAGEFLIGADAAETAVNFEAALDASIQTEAQRSLSAASLYAAANNFFDFDETTPPQRVDGPPFDSATALRDATATDTIFWYQGELSSTSARGSALAKVDDSIITSYGARANEDALRTTIKTFAAVAIETFSDSDPDASARYSEMKQRANSALSFAGTNQSIEDIITEISVAKAAVGRSNERHEANEVMLQGVVDDAENADIFEVSAAILSLQGRLEASLQVSASLSRLSLVNFI